MIARNKVNNNNNINNNNNNLLAIVNIINIINFFFVSPVKAKSIRIDLSMQRID